MCRVSQCLRRGQTIMLTCFPAHSRRNRSWLNVVVGEILTTVEINPRQQPYRWYESEFGGFAASRYLFPFSGCLFKGTFHTLAYTAVNAAGNEGCKYKVRFPLMHSFRLPLIFVTPTVVSDCTCLLSPFDLKLMATPYDQRVLYSFD